MSTWWREWAGMSGLSADARDRGELCLNEAVANIITHGGTSRSIAVTFERKTDAVQMTIADDGKPFNPVTYPEADLPTTLNEASPGGRGIKILRRSASAMAYQRVDGWNALTLSLTP
jgi:serine/threonine-protein kinase RsbW